ncbi:glutamate-rich protein 2 [Paralichthys olivaceus]|uniref:glutamate-rich protein 2 n=1 Tax=Paralichthys olivaceus TaxID=8255 RepID=UPI00097D5DF6|nr:PREDICTED: glutamate-rich protein 2-like [Paralichthys olivaceus]XP_019962166.1 PREDICTED: glutamate-rich protein 2-like [Paralichthys olivaceus]
MKKRTVTGSASEDVQNTGDCVQRESINITPRVEEQAASRPEEEELEMKDCRNTQSPGPGETGGRTHTPPLAEPLHTHEVNEGEGQREEEDAQEEDAQDEDRAAPSTLMRKFLRALVDRNFRLAYSLCQFILTYEPDHPQASVFLSLIKQKLQEEQETEESNEEDEEEDDISDDDEDSGNDEESSQSSSSSSSPTDDDDKEDINEQNLLE